MKIALLSVMALFAVIVGFYPMMYLLGASAMGLLNTKPALLLESVVWNLAFYQHIIFGGLCLLLGWSQFFEKIRSRYRVLHRRLGFSYLVAVLLSGSAGLYLSFFASTGLVAGLGFGFLAIAWLGCTGFAFFYIRRGKVADHREWMIRSFALAFSAVTLRLWMPLLLFGVGLSFDSAYPIIAWLCWVPNILVAEVIIRGSRPREGTLTQSTRPLKASTSHHKNMI